MPAACGPIASARRASERQEAGGEAGVHSRHAEHARADRHQPRLPKADVELGENGSIIPRPKGKPRQVSLTVRTKRDTVQHGANQGTVGGLRHGCKETEMDYSRR